MGAGGKKTINVENILGRSPEWGLLSTSRIFQIGLKLSSASASRKLPYRALFSQKSAQMRHSSLVALDGTLILSQEPGLASVTAPINI